MKDSGALPPTVLAGVAILLLTIGLAGCTDSIDPGASEPDVTGCPDRGTDDPREVTQRKLNSDTTWSPDPSKRADILVNISNLNIHDRAILALDGHTLTIEPCTIVEMGERTGIDASGQGSVLEVLGTPGEQVEIRGSEAEPGHWRGVRIDLAESDGHVLEHAVIEHGNTTGFESARGTVDVAGVGSDTALTISNVAVQASVGNGLFLEPGSDYNQSRGAPNLDLRNNTFTDNTGAGVVTWALLAEHLDPQSGYGGNNGAGVRVMPGVLEATHQWDALTVPYQIAAPFQGGPIKLDGALHIGPGTDIVFEENSNGGIDIRGDDPSVPNPGLFARGTSMEPITITSVTETEGSWDAIWVGGEGTTTLLENTTIAFGGAGQYGQGDHHQGANLALVPGGNGGDFDGYTVRLSDVRIMWSSNDGMQISGHPEIDLSMEGVHFASNNDHPIAVRPGNLGELGADSKFADNGEPGVLIIDGDLPKSGVTFPPLETYYLAQESLSIVEGTVELPAGTHIKFPKRAVFEIGRASGTSGYGSIQATGTASEPVIMEGQTIGRGQWRGLYLTTGSTDNTLEHTHIRHGGADPPLTCKGSNNKSPGGNLIVGEFGRCRAPEHRGEITWLSGSSSEHSGNLAGIWADFCHQITLKTSGQPQVHYPSFNAGQGANCPPPSNPAP